MDKSSSHSDDEAAISIQSENSSTSSTSSDDNEPLPKRYKLPLSSNFQPSHVSRQTQKRWAMKSAMYLQASCNRLATEPSSSAVGSIDSNEQVSFSTETEASNLNDSKQINSDNHNESRQVGDNNDDQEVRYVHGNYEQNFSSENENDSEEEVGSINDNSSNSDSESDSSVDNDEVPNKNREIFDRIMFVESQLKVRDVISMITALALDLKLPDQGKVKLGEFAKILAGDRFSNVSLSKYMMEQCFPPQIDRITYHFYCSKCLVLMHSVKASNKKNNQEIICDKCKAKQKITSNSPNYFLSLDLKYQMQLLLSDDFLLNDILNNVQNRNNCVGDVNAGSIHKKIISQPTETSEIILTVNMNADGAPLTKSGKRGFWPVQLWINDLSPKLRFKNLLLCGLMLTEKEPKSNLLNLFLSKVYVSQMDELYSAGIEVTHNGVDFVFKFCNHGCPVDSVCRPIIQNRLQFNGYCSCSWCYQLGLYINSVRGVRYPARQDDTERTNVTHKKDVERAKLGVICNGVRGESALSELPYFDMVWSFPFEYLHGLLLGPTLQIWNEWKKGNSEYKISKAQVDFIEKRFLHIKPTQEIHRLPRSGIITGSGKPKGSEVKIWLLCYSLCCLKNVLHDEALKHYSLLVKSAYTSLKPAQTETELTELEVDLIKFVVGYEQHYTEENMTFNMHSLIHIASSIRHSGSLCYNSAFPAESNIYTLKTYVTGPKAMDRQIAKKHLQYLMFKTGNITHITSSEVVLQFCLNLFNPVNFGKSFKHGQDIVYCGKGVREAITHLGICMIYKKCIYKSTVYHSEEYNRAKKTNDTVVMLTTGDYARILKIVEYDNNSYIVVQTFNVFPEYPFEGVTHIKQIHSENETELIKPISEIHCKIILVDVRNARYLCQMPNSFEIQ